MPDLEIINDFVQIFDVNRAMALLMILQLAALFVATPIIIFVTVRVGFHAMYFSEYKEIVRSSKKDAENASDRAHEAMMISYRIIKSSLPEPPRDASGAPVARQYDPDSHSPGNAENPQYPA